MPTVTVLMAVYNGQRYVEQALASILEQTFCDFEFLIIDDGSTDSTPQILSRYHDPRVVRLSNRENIGLTQSLNKGLQVARGTYIARMDADDISFPYRLEKQVAFLNFHTNVALVGTDAHYIDAGGAVIATVHVPTTLEEITCALTKDNCFVHGTLMFRKDSLLQVGGYNDTFTFAQDYDLVCRLAARYPVANLNEILYAWRLHEGGLSIRQHSQQQEYARRVRRSSEDRYGSSAASLVPPEKMSAADIPPEQYLRDRLAGLCFRTGTERYAANKIEEARIYFCASLKKNPWCIMPWLYFMSTFAPSRFIMALRVWKRKVAPKQIN